MESTRNRSSIPPPSSGEEDNGVVRLDMDGFKGEDIFTVDNNVESEDGLWGNGGSGKSFSLGEPFGDGVGLLEGEDMIGS